MKRKTTCVLLAVMLVLSNMQMAMAAEESTSEVGSDETETSILSDDLGESSADEQEVTVEESGDTSLFSDMPGNQNTDGVEVFCGDGYEEEDQDYIDGEGGQFFYQILPENEIRITGFFSDVNEEVKIPDQIDGYPVTEIGKRAFYNSGIDSIYIPASVEKIGDYAFYDSGLKGSLDLPEGLEVIGNSAFGDCTRLNGKLTLPSTLLSVGKNAFLSNEWKEITFEEIENRSKVSLDLGQFGGEWYNYTKKSMFSGEDVFLSENETALLCVSDVNVEFPMYTTMRLGEKQYLNYKVYPEKVSDKVPNTLKFTSSTPGVLEIDNSDVIRAIGIGKTTLAATVNGKVKFSMDMEVISDQPAIKKDNMTWHIPEKIKLGYYFSTRIGELSGASIVSVRDLPEDTIGHGIQIVAFDENGAKGYDAIDKYFLGAHAFAGDSLIKDNLSSYVQVPINSATYPGKLFFQVALYDKDDYHIEKTLGEPYCVTIEKPVLKTNAPSKATVGDSFILKSDLQNTALQNVLVQQCLKEQRNKHILLYQPTFEILEGKDLLKCSEKDFTHSLQASEKLTFRKSGTVKIKVKYKRVLPCEMCQSVVKEGIKFGHYYEPEKTITIQVCDKPNVKIKAIKSMGYNRISLSWSSVPNASGYIVYRKDSKNKWEKIAVLKGKVTTYVHKSSRRFPVIPGKTYTYTVRCCKASGKPYGDYDRKGKKVRAIPAAPDLENIQRAGSGLKLQWKKVDGVTGYAVYRYERGKWNLLAKTKKLSYSDRKVQKNVSYRYIVKAYKKVDGKAVYSSRSKIRTNNFL